MVKRSRRTNPIITHEARIGSISAENDDEFLQNCFVSHRAVAEVADANSAKMILSGRTGAGKTAILKHISASNSKTSEIVPSDMSMFYISNSDIIRFLDDIGANLDIFFQTLWKHVIITEYIRLKYFPNGQVAASGMLDSILGFFQTDSKKKAAEKYMQQWGSELWIEIDENIKTLTETYEKGISTALGVDVARFKSKAGFGKNLSVEQKQEFVARPCLHTSKPYPNSSNV